VATDDPSTLATSPGAAVLGRFVDVLCSMEREDGDPAE
jgi:hypothetical protein